MPTDPDRPTRCASPTPDVMPGVRLSALRDVRPAEYLVRFAFGAAVSIAAGTIAKLVSPRFGGMFLAFPAILPASLTLVQDKEGTRRAGRNAIGAVLGGLALVVFAAIGEAGFGHLPAGIVLLLALTLWLVVAVGLYALLAQLRPQDCDRNLE